MALETGVTYIEDLNAANPNEADNDTLDECDNHLRIIKTAVQGSFPNLGAAGVTCTAELNYNDITTLGTAEASKTVTCDASKDVIGLNSVTSTSFVGNITGNASTATVANTAGAWTTARTLTLSGDISGNTGAFDGSGAISLATTIVAGSVAFGSEVATASGADYDFNAGTSSGETVLPAGIYSSGDDATSSSSLAGTLTIEYSVNGLWKVAETMAVSGGAFTPAIMQIVSDGGLAKIKWVYASGSGTTIFRLRKLF